MQLTTYSSTTAANSHSTSKKPTEATATKFLQDHIYAGVGPRFLGWQFPESELTDDGTWLEVKPAGPRYWKSPRDRKDVIKWAPLREHLQGAFRGLVCKDSRFVPYITVDCDRHFASVKSERHKREVLLIGRVLKRFFSRAMGYKLKWCVEVNPRNGSVKFFGWADRPMLTEKATEIGELIHDCLGQDNLLGPKGSLEVFPFNSPQVLLPMRIDKTTIIDSGFLAKCLRDKREWIDEQKKTVKYETYSVLTFAEWLRSGTHYCEQTLSLSLNESCANLPDAIPAEETTANLRAESKSSAIGPADFRSSGSYRHNPNSLERQQAAMLEFCRRCKRVVSVEEGLAFIQQNYLYSGEWEGDLGKRRSRVRWILKRVAKNFDASKCGGICHEIRIGEFDQYVRTHFGSAGIKGRERRDVDEFGSEIIRKNNRRARWKFISVGMSIIRHCLITSPNDDGSLPHARAEKIWKQLEESGRIDIPFSDKKWAILRDELKRRGIVKIVDRNWHRGKAMRWEACQNFEQLPEWWRRRKKPSSFDAVPLLEFLENRNRERGPSLNSYSTQGESRNCAGERTVGQMDRAPP